MSSSEAMQRAESFDRFVGEYEAYHQTSSHLVPTKEIIELHARAIGLYAEAAGYISENNRQLFI